MGTLIRNGRLIDPANQVDRVTDLYLQHGQVAGLGSAPAGFECRREIDADGCLVLPGIIDLRARLREPGQSHKATIASETAAAATSGITSLVLPPDTRPTIDSTAVVKMIRQLSRESGKARVLPLGALTAGLESEQLAQLEALQRVGCIAVSNAMSPIGNTLVMRRALEYAATIGVPVHLYAQDPWLSASGVMHEGAVSSRLGLPGIPEGAEVIGVARDLHLIEQTGVKAHFCSLTTARAVELVAEARARGLPVSADVSILHLYLTERDVDGFNAQCHLRPPLRTPRDLDALRRALADGVVEAICSEHAPHDADAKLLPFPATEPGASTLEVLLPLVLRLVDEGVLDLSSAVRSLTAAPARILGINAGHLGVGSRADLSVVDPNAYWMVDAPSLRSAGKNTPLHGWELKGQVLHTLLEGQLVYSRPDRAYTQAT